jgi:transcriptional pleiotropic regulator of transition state genes
MSLREGWNMDVGCPMEIFTDDDAIILKRYEPGCIFNGTIDDTIDYGGYKVSRTAIREMAKMIEVQ